MRFDSSRLKPQSPGYSRVVTSENHISELQPHPSHPHRPHSPENDTWTKHTQRDYFKDDIPAGKKHHLHIGNNNPSIT